MFFLRGATVGMMVKMICLRVKITTKVKQLTVIVLFNVVFLVKH